MDATDVLHVLQAERPAAVVADAGGGDMPTIVVDRADLVDVCRTLRDHPALQFALLVEVTAADYLPRDPRFEVVYHLVCLGAAYATGSAAPARRLRLKVRLSGDDPRVPSVVPVFPGAGWPEREVFDLFGIVFEGHPDLRRILMPDDWAGYPLRKDYPVQIRKDTASWAPVQLTVEEFAENIRRDRARAAEQSGRPGTEVS